jgi:hypothetical protein
MLLRFLFNVTRCFYFKLHNDLIHNKVIMKVRLCVWKKYQIIRTKMGAMFVKEKKETKLEPTWPEKFLKA